MSKEWVTLSGTRITDDITGLDIFGDSDLIVNQLTGRYRTNCPRLAEFRHRALTLLGELGIPWGVDWIPRAENHEADTLATRAWEEHRGEPFPDLEEWKRKKKAKKQQSVKVG